MSLFDGKLQVNNKVERETIKAQLLEVFEQDFIDRYENLNQEEVRKKIIFVVEVRERTDGVNFDSQEMGHFSNLDLALEYVALYTTKEPHNNMWWMGISAVLMDHTIFAIPDFNLCSMMGFFSQTGLFLNDVQPFDLDKNGKEIKK